MDGIKVANNIRAERSRMNLTIEEVIKELPISKPTYISYEKDASKIQCELLLKLSQLYKCKVEDFFIQK